MPTPPAQQYTDRAADYVRSRPGYPREILALFQKELGLAKNASIADIGSGTGLFTTLLLQTGCLVYAVEPNPEMRRAAEQAHAAHANFRSIPAPAEATTLPDRSVQLITCAQSFHWFDRSAARREFARILCPGGWVVLLWNQPSTEIDAFAQAFQQLTDDFRKGPIPGGMDQIADDDLSVFHAFYAPGSFQTATFDHAQSLDLPGLKGLLLSRSRLPLPGEPRHEEMIQRLPTLFASHQAGGVVTLHYRTDVFYGRLTEKP